MKLDFEFTQEVGQGTNSDLIHLWDNEANMLYVENGRLQSKVAIVDNGEWEDRIFEDEVDISKHDNIEHFRIDSLGGFGAVGSYKDGNRHFLLIYEYQKDISEHLNDGSIKHSIGNPISSFSLSLENAENQGEEEGNIAVSENSSLINPGTKIIFRFGAGNELATYELGTFYVDRTNFTVTNNIARIDGRNLIGKALKDQTLNENYYTGFRNVDSIIKNMLKGANLIDRQFVIEPNGEQRRYIFNPNTEILAGIEEILKSLVNWKIEENTDGKIIIGNPNFSGFQNRGIYSFSRDKDIFSRQITRDDQGSYKRVCVHDKEFDIEIYKEVETYEGWNLQSNKTFFVEVAEGTSIGIATAIANEVAGQLENVGNVESFNGPIRPHLSVGDGAWINDKDGSRSLGLITEITHNFGKNGFYTSFTVDSGGQQGRGRLSDYINMLSGVTSLGSTAYDEYIDPVADLTTYNYMLNRVDKTNYTPTSWNMYQVVVANNVVTENNTQAEVNLATSNIIIAQTELVTI